MTSERPEHRTDRPDTVAVFKSGNANSFHRLDEDSDDPRPACGVGYDDRPDRKWSEWDINMAEDWRSPCTNHGCFGYKRASRRQKTAWPVETGGADD